MESSDKRLEFGVNIWRCCRSSGSFIVGQRGDRRQGSPSNMQRRGPGFTGKIDTLLRGDVDRFIATLYNAAFEEICE